MRDKGLSLKQEKLLRVVRLALMQTCITFDGN